MPECPAPLAPDPAPVVDRDAEDAELAADATDGADAAAFGSQEPTRTAADVEYRGRAEGHDYLVRARHRFLDTRFTVVIDGIEHDPRAEATARGAEETGGGAEPGTAEGGTAASDGLRFRFEENFTVLYCTVRRPGVDGDPADAEVITVRTAGLGGAGEVDVRHGLERTLLAPADGSPSAARDARRSAHPARSALVAALAKAAGFLLPLLGIGALLSGLLTPITTWIGARIRPVLDAVDRLVEPVRLWIADLLRPVQEFFDALFSPIREAAAAVLAPLVKAWERVMELLLGWIPDLALPFPVPDWLARVALAALVLLVVYLATYRRLRRRRELLDEARSTAPSGVDGENLGPESTEAEPADSESGSMASETTEAETTNASSSPNRSPERDLGR